MLFRYGISLPLKFVLNLRRGGTISIGKEEPIALGAQLLAKPSYSCAYMKVECKSR